MSEKYPTLSLCMIVKNEEAMLGRCLESVSDFVDEMIIVDTGSEDKTVEIAESYGAKVYHHPWQGSFSEARNYGLQYAACDWILQLDADEAFKQEDVPALKKILIEENLDAVFLAILNETADGWTKHYFQRLFRRGRARYQGIVHNQLVYSGADLKTEITLYHYGYNLSGQEMAEKYERTKSLLLKQLHTNPADVFAQSNYVRTLRASGDFAGTIEAGFRALDQCQDADASLLQMIQCDIAYALALENRMDEAAGMARDILGQFPHNLDVLYLMGNLQFKLGKFREALKYYEHFIEVKETGDSHAGFRHLIVDTFGYEDRVYGHIGDCHVRLGENEKALAAFEKAIALNPGTLMSALNKFRLLFRMNQLEEAGAFISTVIAGKEITDQESAAVLSILKEAAGNCIQSKQFQPAIQILSVCLTVKSDDVSALADIATCYAQMGHWESAIQGYEAALQLAPEHPGLLKNLSIIKNVTKTQS